MSNCEKCDYNTIPMVISCAKCITQAKTDQGIRSKILNCHEFTPSKSFDYVPRDQSGAVI